MLEKIYFHLLILCGILCHGIIAKLSDDDNSESPNLLAREKRVISHLPRGLKPTRIDKANYMVSVKKNNRIHCAGAILTHSTVITAAQCVLISLYNYQVLSGAGDDRFSDLHTVNSKLTYYGNLPHKEFDGIALITVNPPFVYGRKTGYIQLHVGSVPAGTQATVNGWGCTYPIHPIPNLQRRLRTITLPIMNHEECQTAYRGRFNITEKHLCTSDNNQHCARHDAGAPLVVANRMVGIHVWKGQDRNVRNPDVFINLQRADYSEWIREHTMLM